MSLIIDEYPSKLINAESPQELQSFIYNAIKEMKEQKVQPYIIKRFLDTTVNTLQGYNTYNYNSHQLANIKMSITLLNQFKTSISHVPVKRNRNSN